MIKEHLPAVERYVGFSVNHGETSCHCDAVLRKQTIAWPRELGYTVEGRSNQRAAYHT